MKPAALVDAADNDLRELAIVAATLEGTPWASTLPKARRLVETLAVTQLTDRLWLVRGDTGDHRVDATYVPWTCTCTAASFHKSTPCSHRTAVELVKRCQAGDPRFALVRDARQEKDEMMEDVMEPRDVESIEPLPVSGTEDAPNFYAHQHGGVMTPAKPKIDPRYIVDIKGKKAVTYAGLLDMAHAMGLHSLTLEPLEVTQDHAMFMATATMKDGGVFMDVGDATPANVTPMVKLHFIRVAATRAKARALKNACNVELPTVEELHDDVQDAPAPRAVPQMTPAAPKTPSNAPDYRVMIEDLLRSMGKTEEEIDEYASGLKTKYGSQLLARLPGIYKALEAKAATMQPVGAEEGAPW